MSHLTPLEIACGMAIGLDATADRLPDPPAGRTVLEVLEDRLATYLADPPCRIAFSGGLDSSVLLALCTKVARERDLPAPVPVTAVFPDVAASEETEWQELVVRHLGLDDTWERVVLREELDLVGPAATDLLRRCGGSYWPGNSHFVALLAGTGSGGCLLTGTGGDELRSRPFYRSAIALREHRRLPSRARDLPAAVVPLLPTPVRMLAGWRGLPPAPPYLTPRARAAFKLRRGWHDGQQPAGWDRVIGLLWRSRYLQASLPAVEHLEAMTGVRMADPFFAPEVLAAYARSYGAEGPPQGLDTLRDIARELLPAAVFDRRTKASFSEAFWRDGTRRFAQERAVDHLPDAVARLVDRDALRTRWRTEDETMTTYLLVQSAWHNFTTS